MTRQALIRQVLTTSEDRIFLCSDVLQEKVRLPADCRLRHTPPNHCRSLSLFFPSTAPLLAFQ